MYTETPYFPQVNPLQQVADRLAYELRDLFQVSGVRMRGQGLIAFTGRLLYEPDSSFDEIQRRFRALGYTPTLRSENGEDLLVAQQGLLARANTGNPLINLLLLIVTLFTTLAAGAALSGVNLVDALTSAAPLRVVAAIVAGLPFAGTLLAILGIHELGHYLAARYHKVSVTLPYFIPMPFNGIGTLGAFIALKSPMKNRKELFDIGIAGPLAGFAVAVPLLIVGVLLSPVVRGGVSALTLDFVGSSLFIDAVVAAFKTVPAGGTLALHPVLFAAWLGVLITGINLLPVGQLDGGHIAYALFGRRAHTIARVAFLLLLLAGLTLSSNWFFWALLALIGGLRHPAPLNDLSRLGLVRRLIGYATIALFFLIIIPQPFGG